MHADHAQLKGVLSFSRLGYIEEVDIFLVKSICISEHLGRRYEENRRYYPQVTPTSERYTSQDFLNPYDS